MVTFTRRVAVNAAVIDAKLGDEAVLLNVETGVYFGLDEIGTRIWDLLIAGVTPNEIVTQLLDEYDVEREQLCADVRDFLQALVRKGLAQELDG